MSSYNLAPVANWFSNFGSNTAASTPNNPLSGGLLWTYSAGTVTPTPVYTTNAGIAWTNPIVLGPDGRVPGAIWLAAGGAYKFVLQDSQGNNIPNGTLDNIIGINDTSGSGGVSEWVSTGFVPTFVSATSFTTPGNTTSTFQIGRRVQALVTAGTVYGTVTASAFTTSTLVTLLMDTGMALDGGLSQVNVGFLNGSHPSVPGVMPYPLTATVLTATTSATLPNATISGASTWSSTAQPFFKAHLSTNTNFGFFATVIFNTIDEQQGGTNYNSATGVYTFPNTGVYLLTCSGFITNITGVTESVGFNFLVNSVAIPGSSCFVANSVNFVASGAAMVSATAGQTATISNITNSTTLTSWLGGASDGASFSVVQLF